MRWGSPCEHTVLPHRGRGSATSGAARRKYQWVEQVGEAGSVVVVMCSMFHRPDPARARCGRCHGVVIWGWGWSSPAARQEVRAMVVALYVAVAARRPTASDSTGIA